MKKYRVKIFYGNSYLTDEIVASGLQFGGDGRSSMFYTQDGDATTRQIVKVIPTDRLYIVSIEDAE